MNLIKARTFAAVKHNGHIDDSGKDYYMHHLVPVCEAVSTFTNDEEIQMAAILHDTIEDTDTTYGELVKEFGERVADLVNEVTDEGKKDSYGKYFPRLKTADGILIKLCDRASNVSRMECWNPKRRQHYLNKTKFWKDGSDRKCKECEMTELEHKGNGWIGKPGHCSGFVDATPKAKETSK